MRGFDPARDGGRDRRGSAPPRRDSDGARVAIVHAESARSRVERRAFVQRNGRAGFPRGRRTKPSCLFGGGRRRSRRSVSISGSSDASTIEVVFDGGGGRSRPQASRVVASARTGGWFAKGSYGGGCVWPSRLRAVVSNGVDAAAVQIVAWSTLGGGVWSRARRARDGRRERAEGAILAGEALDGGGARGGSRRGVLRGGSRGARRAVVDVSTVSRDRGWRARGRGATRALGDGRDGAAAETRGWRVVEPRLPPARGGARARSRRPARASPKPLDRPTRADEDIGRRAVARGGVPMTASSSASSCMRSSRRSSWRSCSSSRARYDEVAIAARSAAEGVDVPSQGIHARARLVVRRRGSLLLPLARGWRIF